MVEQKADSELLARIGLADSLDNATHLAWATGGNMVPAEERAKYYSLGEKALTEAFGR